MTERPDPARVMRIVNHPVRMRTIELLSVKPMSWKELSTELGVRTGALYHHLDTLEGIVTRDAERRYALTPLGREIYAQLSDEKMTPAQSLQGIERAMSRRTLAGSATEVFVPRGVIVRLTSSRPRALASLAAISCLVVGLLVYSGDQLVLFSFSPSGSASASVSTFLGSLGALAAVAYVSLAVAFKERGDLFTLVTSSALSFVPLSIFGALLGIAYGGSTTGSAGLPVSLFSNGAFVTVVFAFFQAWGAGIVGAGMSVASGLRVEKTLVVSLVVLYATMLIVLVQGGRLA
ncbi:MAG: winged helix-turn-helix transcriptional regulator [Nitrososphaerota archaeon]|nr:winged helix-turn-helix transcriptional regulator [Nitrososphaerota archaeon]MDG7021074.1 winged helix-turn-helix transcriptional regulator [Nitrososphaerota archaeon]